MLRLVYSPAYTFDIGLHVFPTRKYALVHDRLQRRPIPPLVVEPDTASWADLALVHTTGYLRKLRDNTLSPIELARLEVPWSPVIADAFRRMSGGTLTAARLALTRGVTTHLGGGFHHAFADHGEGFCAFNDVALAVRVLSREQLVDRVAIIDCDVHHGNGTAALFADDPKVFTFSMHQEHNYPAEKPPSSLDVGLSDGVSDEEYLSRLSEALPEVVAHRPGIAFYLAGADPFRGDQLGGLALTKSGLRQRDRLVAAAMRRAHVPLVVTLAGGYARDLDDTVDIHVATVETVSAISDQGET